MTAVGKEPQVLVWCHLHVHARKPCSRRRAALSVVVQPVVGRPTAALVPASLPMGTPRPRRQRSRAKRGQRVAVVAATVSAAAAAVVVAAAAAGAEAAVAAAAAAVEEQRWARGLPLAPRGPKLTNRGRVSPP